MRLIFCLLGQVIFSFSIYAQEATSIIIRGNQYYQQGQFDLAETQYRKALDIDPKNTTAQYNLANALQKQKKYEEAYELLESFSKSLTDKNLKSASFYNQGVAYTKLKKLEESIESYKNALRLNPDDQQARENLQKALLELKQKQQQKDQKQKQEPKMSQKEAEQKLKLLQQKEKELQERMKNKNKQQGNGQAKDW